MKSYFLLLGVALFGLIGCQADQEGLNNRAAIEGKASSDAGIQAQNANLVTRSTEMETDLERRRRFIDSVAGTYEGTISDGHGNETSTRIIINSSFPRSPDSQRTRSIEELTYELSNLHLNVQVVEWSTVSENSEVAFGCVFEQVRPNIVDGVIHLMSQECKMSYQLFATELGANAQLPSSSAVNTDFSRGLAAAVVGGRLTEISAFVGRKQSNLSSQRFPLRVRKIAIQ